MRKAGIIRLTGALVGTSTVITAIALGIEFGLKNDSFPHTTIRVVVNQTKTKSWYKADSSTIYGPIGYDHQGLIAPKLLRVSRLGINDYNRDSSGNWVKRNNIIKAIRFELADYIILKDENDKIIGSDSANKPTIRVSYDDYKAMSPDDQKKFQWDDEIKSFDTKTNHIESGDRSIVLLQHPSEKKDKPFELAAKVAKGGFEIHIRNDQHWTDHNGKKTKYLLKAKDFFYALGRTIVSGSYARLNPNNVDNPYGGFGDKRGWPLTKKEKAAVLKESSEIDSKVANFQKELAKNANASSTAMGTKNNYPNDYLYGLNGYKGMLTTSIPQVGTGLKYPFNINANSTDIINWNNSEWTKHGEPKQAGHGGGYLNYPTMGNPATRGKIDGEIAKGNLKGIMVSMLAESLDISPAPSDFIKERMTTKNVDLPQGGSLAVPNGLAKALGYGTYAQTFEKALYIGPMYMSESSTNRTKYKKNQFYWNQKWVKSKNSINIYIKDFVLQPDKSLFAQSQLSAFNAGRISRMSLNNQSAKKKLVLQSRKEAKFSKGHQATSTVGWLLPNLKPHAAKESDFSFNDGYSKLVYGATRKKLIAGNRPTVFAFTSPKAIEFRSLLSAAINWYTLAKEMKNDNSTIGWTTSMPPNMIINPNLNGSEEQFTTIDKSKNIDRISDMNTLKAYGNNASGKMAEIKFGSNSLGDWNKAADWFVKKSSNSAISLQTPYFKTIQDRMKKLIDAENLGAGEKVSYEVKNFLLNYINAEDGFKGAVNVINSIYPEKLEIKNLRTGEKGPILTNYPDAATRNAQFRGSSQYIFSGWSADYQGFGTMLTSLDSFGHVSLSAAIKRRAKTNHSYAVAFKNVVAYATIFEDKYKTFLADVPADLRQGLLPNIDALADHMNNTNGIRLASALVKPNWDTIITNKAKQAEFKRLKYKLSFFESIVDREIQITAADQAKTNTDPELKDAYLSLSTIEGAVGLITEFRDLAGLAIEKERSIKDPTTPTASLWNKFTQITTNNYDAMDALNIIVDTKVDKINKGYYNTRKEWLNGGN